MRPDGESSLLAISVIDARISEATAMSRRFSLPSWAPRGSIAVVTIDGSQIWLLNVETGELSYLAKGEGAVFLPGGDELVVYAARLSDPESGEPAIRIIDLQGNVLRSVSLGLTAESPEGRTDYITALSLSPDGRLLLMGFVDYGSDRNTYTTYAVDVGSGSRENPIPHPDVVLARWAPDGSRLAYIRTIDGSGVGELVVADTSWNCLLRPSLPAEVRAFTWSPDGSRIAFLYRGAVFLLDLEGIDRDDRTPVGCQ